MRNKGFTLLELSIALVIIGLLVGGVLAGKNLIEAAKLSSIVSDVDRFKKAQEMFAEQYGGFAGDLSTATQIWGAADGGDGLGSDCTSIASQNKTTCNGDGNGRIDLPPEKLRQWQHLANAGYLQGSYTGAYNADGTLEADVNSPKSQFTGGVYEMHFQPGPVFGRSGHYIKIAAVDTGGVGANFALLSATQAHSLDLKTDDGLADTGNVIALDSFNVSGCVTGGTSATAPSDYILANTHPACRFYFWLWD
jgi:prepilin-type N-terminal cleavage/methylation domain-containing protein